MRSEALDSPDLIESIAPPFERSVHYRLMCLVLLGWWIAFLYPAVATDSILQDLQRAGESTEQGSLSNQIIILTFAALGFLHLPRAVGVLRSNEGKALISLFGLYFAWATASVLWSAEQSLTVRRLISFFFLLIGSFGLGAGFYGRTRNAVLTLGRHVIYGSLVAVLLLIASRFQDNTLLELLDPRFSLKDTTRIAAWTYPCGYALLAAIVVYGRERWKQFGAVLLFILVLIVLKGRTFIGDVLASATLLYSRVTTGTLRRAAALIGGVTITAVIVDLSTGGALFINWFLDLYERVAALLPYLTLGEGMRNITSLSGRLPLWRALYGYIADHPWGGIGFGAFWSAPRFDEIYATAGWRAVVAHNGFLDELLATGAVGLFLLMSAWIGAMVLSLRANRFQRSGSGYLVFAWLLLFLLFNSLDSIIQNFFQAPTFISLIAVFGILTEFSEYTAAQFETELLSGEFIMEEMPQ
jgi:O-antigen ligase